MIEAITEMLKGLPLDKLRIIYALVKAYTTPTDDADPPHDGDHE